MRPRTRLLLRAFVPEGAGVGCVSSNIPPSYCCSRRRDWCSRRRLLRRPRPQRPSAKIAFDRKSGMAASIAKDFDNRSDAPLMMAGTVAEIGDAVHKPAHFHNPADPVQIAIKGGLCLRDDIQSANTRRFLHLRRNSRHRPCRCAAICRSRKALGLRCRVCCPRAYVIRGRRRRIRGSCLKLREMRVDFSSHFLFLK